MGLALAQGLITRAKDKILKLSICEKDKDRWDHFHGLEVSLSSDLTDYIIKDHEIIILAVKPQNIDEVLAILREWSADKLVISIAAGIKIFHLSRFLKSSQIVRVMPNIPAIIGEGCCSWIGTNVLSFKNKNFVKSILEALGREIEVSSEEMMDAVTALSGCGPAYFFYILRQMINCAKGLGLDENSAKLLAIQTMRGSAKLCLVSNDSLETLQNKVASKGGTTEKALKVFEDRKLGEIIQEGMKAAFLKSKELSR